VQPPGKLYERSVERVVTAEPRDPWCSRWASNMSDLSSELSPGSHEGSLMQPPGKLYERSVERVVAAE